MTPPSYAEAVAELKRAARDVSWWAYKHPGGTVTKHLDGTIWEALKKALLAVEKAEETPKVERRMRR